jgi:transposase, IS5 family
LKAKRIFRQKSTDKNKLYSCHAPEVECIGKGKASKPYEFGCKVSIISTLKPCKVGHLLLQAEALHHNPFDGHT